MDFSLPLDQPHSLARDWINARNEGRPAPLTEAILTARVYPSQYNVLMLAIEREWWELAHELVTAGIDVHAVDQYGNNAAHLLFTAAEDYEVIEGRDIRPRLQLLDALAQKGLTPTLPNRDGNTADGIWEEAMSRAKSVQPIDVGTEGLEDKGHAIAMWPGGADLIEDWMRWWESRVVRHAMDEAPDVPRPARPRM